MGEAFGLENWPELNGQSGKICGFDEEIQSDAPSDSKNGHGEFAAEQLYLEGRHPSGVAETFRFAVQWADGINRRGGQVPLPLHRAMSEWEANQNWVRECALLICSHASCSV